MKKINWYYVKSLVLIAFVCFVGNTFAVNTVFTERSFSESLEIQQEEPGYLFEYDKITNVPGLILARTKPGSPLKVVEINNNGVVTADLAIAYFENEGYKLVLYLYGSGNMKEKVKNIDNYDFLNSDNFLATINITLSNGERLTTIMLVENQDIDNYNLAQITLAVDKMFSSSCDKNSNKELWQKYILKQLSTYNIIKIKANDTIFNIVKNFNKNGAKPLKTAKTIKSMYNWINAIKAKK